MNTYSVQIAPQLRRQITELDVIQSAGTLYFAGPGIEFHAHGGILFAVHADSYRLAVLVRDGQLVIARNGLEAIARVPNSPSQVTCYAAWDPLMVYAFAGAPEETGPLTAAHLDEMRVCAYSQTPVVPPTGLIQWARREALTPQTTYGSMGEGVNATVTALRGLEDKIRSHGMQHAFWDLTRDGNRVVSKRPKRETDIHPTLAGLLADAAMIRNIEVVRERPTGGGKLDFALLAPLTAGGSARVCAEFKAAHSADVVHGLTRQLPAYMQSEGAELGIYGVLWFKGSDFDEPSEAEDPTALQVDLDIAAREAGVRDVRVLTINVAFGSAPSKLSSSHG